MLKRNLRLWAFTACALVTTNANAAEICGNGIDDDSNGLTDEGCFATTCESPLSCADTGNVSPKKGALQYQLPPDLSPSVPYGPGIGLRRFYLSQYAPPGTAPAYRTAFGPRWGWTYGTWTDDISAGRATKFVFHTSRGQDIILNQTSQDATWNYYTPQAGGIHFKEVKRRRASPNEMVITQLSGDSMQLNSSGRLTEVRDTLLNNPNKVLVVYDGSGQVSTVTDASGTRRLLFAYTGGVASSVKFQLLISAVWTDQQTTTYNYTSGNLTSAVVNGVKLQSLNYTSNYLTSIQDNELNTLTSFAYDSATPGKVALIDTARGVVGWEFASTRAECVGQTVLYFHKANLTSCASDTDCGTGNLCGGKTGAGTTGQCFRGARCLTVTSPSEDVITTISAFAGNSQTCDGACLDSIDHVWNSTGGALDLTSVKDPSSHYRVSTFNGNGRPLKIVYGDVDTNPDNGNGQREVYLTYGSTSYPGLVTEVRRKSDLKVGTCSPSDATACAITNYSYVDGAGAPIGKITQLTQSGFTLDGANSVVPFSYLTATTFDAQGRRTSIDGPLSGNGDLTQFAYWTASGDVKKDGFLQTLTRRADASHVLTQQALDYDFWGNATRLQDADGTISCQTFDPFRDFLTQRREQMAGQSDCTVNAADLVTSYARDSQLRLTQLTRPDGSCVLYEYDPRGRLLRTKRRDDCSAISTGDTEELSYSEDGLVIKVEDKDAANTVTRRRELTYFDSRRLEKLINPVNTAKWTGLSYEIRGLLDAIAAVDGANNLSKTQWTYNEEGRVATEKRFTAGSAFDTWSLLFSWLGDQKQVTDGDSKLTSSSRDDLGRVVSLSGVDLPYPTLRLYDAASRLVTVKEAYGAGVAEQDHSFTFDNLGRSLVANHAGLCSGIDNPDITRVYDSLSGAPSCPVGASCTNLAGRLAYVKVKLMCQPSLADKTLEQETWFGYDAAGRLTNEYISDDNGRTAAHVYAWTKNGALQQVTLPSTAVLGATFGSATSNSDTDRITALWRTSTGTPIIDTISYEPFGPVKIYNQKNSPGTGFLRTRIVHNLAYRQTLNTVEKTTGTNTQSSVTLTEDAKGRVTTRDYFPSDPTIAGRRDSWYSYDQQDRVLCESSTSGACPTSGTTLKNNHSASPPFMAAGDWKQLKRPIAGSTGVTHDITLWPGLGNHQMYSVAQLDGTPALGTTYFSFDVRGDRWSDDNLTTLTHDGRVQTIDGRRNVTNVRGEYFTGGAWHFYDVASAFDAKNRRVFKSFFDETTAKTATWFFYYDALDRLAEVRYTPDSSVATTYSQFQLVWLGQKLVAYWQTDLPSSTTSKRYVSTDEMNRPIDMMSWPASGAAARVWTINPDAWGNDTVLVGSSVFQPILFAGQYKDDETAAWQNDGVTKHRPGVVLNGFRTYDPWVGSYLQVDPLVDSTWSSYTYANSGPVGHDDRNGNRIAVNNGDDIIGGLFFGDCYDSNSTESVSNCLGRGGPPRVGPIGGGGGSDVAECGSRTPPYPFCEEEITAQACLDCCEIYYDHYLMLCQTDCQDDPLGLNVCQTLAANALFACSGPCLVKDGGPLKPTGAVLDNLMQTPTSTSANFGSPRSVMTR